MKKILLSLLTISLCQLASAQISITTIGTPYTQNFDAMPATTASGFHAMNIPGWAIYEKGQNANDSLRIGAGAQNAGDTYNFGTAAATDRAIGGVASGTNQPHFGCSFQNNTGVDLASVQLNYVGEQWRSGDTIAGNIDSLIFEYALNAAGLFDSTVTWTEVNALSLYSPNPNAPTGALDGNLPANQTAKSASFNVTITNGDILFIRWKDINRAGSDDGLAVDDLTVSFVPLNNDKPLITHLIPTDGTANVPISVTQAKVVFDRAISLGASGEARLVNITDATTQTIALASCSVLMSDTGLIAGLSLSPNKDYALQFDSTLFVSGVHNSYGIYDNTTWNFDTKVNNVSVNDTKEQSFALSIYATESYSDITIHSKESAQVALELLDNTGRLLSTQSLNLQQGQNKARVDMSRFASGMYYIRLHNATERISQKFIK